MGVLDFSNLNDKQIIDKKHLIPNSSNQASIFINILSRKEAKNIIDEIFGYFLLNPDKEVLGKIFDEKYKHIFNDLIKDNIEEVIRVCIRKQIINLLIAYGNFDLIIDNFKVVLESENPIYGVHELIGTIHDEKIFHTYGNEIIDALSKQVKDKFLEPYLYKKLIDIMSRFLEKDKLFNYEENEDKLLVILDSMENSCGYESTTYASVDSLNVLFELARKSKIIEKYINENIDMITSIFLGVPKALLENSNNYPKDVNMLNHYSTLIKDILHEEDTSLKDVYCDCGVFSKVLIIGGKVLKVGEKNTKYIPYDKRLLMPLIRTDAYHGVSYKDGYFKRTEMVEVYEKTDLSNISEEDCYEIFIELLQRGILWADPKPDNLGRLLKPNNVYLKGAYKQEKDGEKTRYYVDNKSVYMYKANSEVEVLDKGELVIIDLDLVYDIRKLDLLKWIDKKINNGCDIRGYDVLNYIDNNSHEDINSEYLEYIEKYLNQVKEKNKVK